MGKITIQNYTCKNPITMIGFEAGICWGADTADEKKNYRRGLDCLESGHGRTFEFPDVYLTLEGYSARVVHAHRRPADAAAGQHALYQL